MEPAGEWESSPAHAHACVKLAEGRTLLQWFVYKLVEAEMREVS